MKRMLLVLLVALILVGCTPGAEVDEALNYPGLSWGMTYEEVAKILHISPDQVLRSWEYNQGSCLVQAYTVSELELYGRPAPVATLRFYSYHDEVCGLGQLIICYPEDTDREELRADLSKHYGNDVRSWTESSWDYFQEKMVTTERTVPEGSNQWRSEVSMLEATDLEFLERIYPRVMAQRKEDGFEKLPTFEQYLTGLDGSVCTVTLFRNYSEQHHPLTELELEQGWTNCVVTVSGMNYLYAKNVEHILEE